jgi:hypothetical protein
MASLGLPQPPNGAAPAQLGRFADWITAGVIAATIGIALFSQVGAFGWHSTPLIDLFATISIGAVLGRAGGIIVGQAQLGPAQTAALETINTNTRSLVARAELNTAIAEAAHRRLDAIAAPAAPVDHTGMFAGSPTNGTVDGKP